MHLSDKVVREQGPLHRILEYTPPKFDIGVPEPAKDYIEIKRTAPTSFKMAEQIKIQTGVDHIEAVELEDQVEQRTLEKLKIIQESAYKEAYTLGLVEGKKEAFDKASLEIDARLIEMDRVLKAVASLKTELVQQNEAHIVKLAFHIAKRLAYHAIEVNQDVILEVIRSSIAQAQIEEEVTVQVSPSQYEFLDKLKTETGRDFEFLKKIKLVSDDQIKSGGCIIETNYGQIDARFEERVEKVWSQFSENLHKVKNKVSAA
jgi:flagellar assembly protein FliH